ncbi:hypothetical protein Acr_10g0009830 [Actinidia rufa]|uniref:Transposase (putative) gypsy type domain-containing protein n=1 Tax=Actinidia rufa TaxID=165716 RepID=A0A7J0FA74_9ERIC|nr:hypothetical protein Acr_10g0009830 [Actinidia rufa]
MSNGDSTANVGDVVEMESQAHLILKVTGEVEIGGELIEPMGLPHHEFFAIAFALELLLLSDVHPGLVTLPLLKSFNTRPLLERETNTMTQGELDRLRKSCSIPSRIHIRLPEADKTIAFTRLGEVAFYEVLFQDGLRLPIHATIRRILVYYNICPTQLAPNAWRSIVDVVVLWRFHKFVVSLNEFRNLFSLFNNPKPDSGCLYFKARLKKTLLEGLALDSRKMVSSGGDNTEDKPVGDAAHVMGDKGSPSSSSISSLEAWLDPALPPEIRSAENRHEKACPNGEGDGLGGEGRGHWRETPSRRDAKHLTLQEGQTGGRSQEEVANVAPEDKKKWPTTKAITKFFHVIGQNVAKDLEGRVAELEAKKQYSTEELRRVKEECDANLERLQKEVAELKEREALAKTLAVESTNPLMTSRRLWNGQLLGYFGKYDDIVHPRRVRFCLTNSFSDSMLGTMGEEHPRGGATSSSGDAGEFRPSHEHVQQQSPSRDDLIECLGSIRTKLRRILPHVPDLTLLRWSGGKLCQRESASRISVRSSKNQRMEVLRGPCSCQRGGDWQEAPRRQEGNPFRQRSDHRSHGLVMPRGGYFGQPRHCLGPHGFYSGQPIRCREAFTGSNSPTNKEKVDKLTLDQTATKLFHMIGQLFEVGRRGSTPLSKEGQSASMGSEISRLQKLSADLEQQLAEARAHKQQANDNLAKMKSNQDSLADKFERSGVLVVELREALDKAKESAVEEFKSSSEFLVAVEDSASKYFGEGFEFCKV